MVLYFFSINLSLLSNPIGEITWTDSFLDPADQIFSNRLKYGYITVPEDYNKPEGRLLKIAFVVIEAGLKDQAEKDASIYFMGGWGSRSIKNLAYYQNHFLSRKRDLILYDYRGTGYSEPKLCEDLGPRVFDNILANKSYPEFEREQKLLFDACLDQLEEQGIDYNQYGTNNKARDGVLLAKALKYDSYNLFGVSYGTKTILQFIRQSEVKIRSAILDSNCPLDFPINSGMTEDYAKSLEHILEDCENDSTCKQEYPDLRESLESFLLSLDSKPLKIKLPKSKVGYLNRQEVNGIMHQLLYDEGSYGMIPFLLDKFSKRKKFIIKRIVRDLEELVSDNYNGVGLVNYVYDHKPFRDKAVEIARQSLSNHPTFHVFDGYQNYFFEEERFYSDLESTQTLHTDIPALIMAGGYDPITPVYYSKMIQKYFRNHFYVEFPRTGHGVTDNRCGRSMAKNFLNTLQNPLSDPCFEKAKNQEIVFER